MVLRMNKRQKEVEKKKLEEEKKLIRKLKKIYAEAAEEVQKKIRISNGKINFLLSEYDQLTDKQKSLLQSQIYQRDFQKNILKQLDKAMDELSGNAYKSIDEYLNDAYYNGYIGSLYDIAGQGIPLIIPIDQKQVTRAMTHDTKLSTSLYARMGIDANNLKKKVAGHLARGIATVSSYAMIARNIDSEANIGFNKAMRIARTEAHRIQILGAYDAQTAAKKKGCDVVKQWDATLDGRTRPLHRVLDGKLAEVDEPFVVDDMEVMYPGGFGIASQDINCRCALLQRARWALNADELKTLKERAEYYELDKSDDFQDFKSRYLKVSKGTKCTQKINSFEEITMNSIVKKVNKEELKTIIENSLNVEDFEKLYAECKEKTIREMVSSTEKIMPKKMTATRKMREAMKQFKLDNPQGEVQYNHSVRKQLGEMSKEESVKQIMKDLNVTSGKANEYIDEIHYFTKNGYKEVRNISNTNTNTKFARKTIEDFISASPKYNGNIYRGIKFDGNVGKQFVSNLVEGSELDMNGISSWSSSLEYAQKVASNHNLEYQIVFSCKNKSGVGIEHISTMPEEKEVLQSAGSRFRVISVKKSGTHYMVEMEEV